jgi:hypothetical protein
MIPVNEPAIGEREIEYVLDCLRTGWISSAGHYIEDFEAAWAAYCWRKYGVAVSNGTVALEILDVGQQTCTVRYRMWHLSGKQVIAETQESHVVRYFFPQELAFLLECAGFTLIRLGTFPELDHEPDETTWNVLGGSPASMMV